MLAFGAAILFERVMPVQVVRREIQEHADVGGEMVFISSSEKLLNSATVMVVAGLLHSRNQGSYRYSQRES